MAIVTSKSEVEKKYEECLKKASTDYSGVVTSALYDPLVWKGEAILVSGDPTRYTGTSIPTTTAGTTTTATTPPVVGDSLTLEKLKEAMEWLNKSAGRSANEAVYGDPLNKKTSKLDDLVTKIADRFKHQSFENGIPVLA